MPPGGLIGSVLYVPKTLFMVSRRILFSWSLDGDYFHGPKTLFVVSSLILFSFIVPWTLVMVIYPLLYTHSCGLDTR